MSDKNTYFYTFEIFNGNKLVSRGTGVIEIERSELLQIEKSITDEVMHWAGKGDLELQACDYVFISNVNKL